MGALGSVITPTATLVSVLVALLASVPFLEVELSYGFTRNTTATPSSAPIQLADGLPYTRRTVRFDSEGTSCEAWLYTPTTVSPTVEGEDAPPPSPSSGPWPVVIMAHGLGGQKDLGLHRFADMFARAELAVLVFDYRTFGGSDGEPRQWVSPRRHLQDWRAAVRFVQSGALGEQYDGGRVALWGTSFAGGHVLVTAADLAAEGAASNVSCVVSMVPHLDGVESSKANLKRRGLPGTLRLLAAGLHDRLRQAAGLDVAPPPAGAHPAVGRLYGGAYVKLVGREDELAIMQLSESELKSYYGKHPPEKQGGWRPVALARFALEASAYRPIASVPRIPCPVLFISATRDALCPHALVQRAAGLLPGESSGGAGNGATAGGSSRLVEFESSHFDIYHGEHGARAGREMVEFIRKHTGGDAGALGVGGRVRGGA